MKHPSKRSRRSARLQGKGKENNPNDSGEHNQEVEPDDNLDLGENTQSNEEKSPAAPDELASVMPPKESANNTWGDREFSNQFKINEDGVIGISSTIDSSQRVSSPALDYVSKSPSLLVVKSSGEVSSSVDLPPVSSGALKSSSSLVDRGFSEPLKKRIKTNWLESTTTVSCLTSTFLSGSSMSFSHSPFAINTTSWSLTTSISPSLSFPTSSLTLSSDLQSISHSSNSSLLPSNYSIPFLTSHITSDNHSNYSSVSNTYSLLNSPPPVKNHPNLNKTRISSTYSIPATVTTITSSKHSMPFGSIMTPGLQRRNTSNNYQNQNLNPNRMDATPQRNLDLDNFIRRTRNEAQGIRLGPGQFVGPIVKFLTGDDVVRVPHVEIVKRSSNLDREIGRLITEAEFGAYHTGDLVWRSIPILACNRGFFKFQQFGKIRFNKCDDCFENKPVAEIWSQGMLHALSLKRKRGVFLCSCGNDIMKKRTPSFCKPCLKVLAVYSKMIFDGKKILVEE